MNLFEVNDDDLSYIYLAKKKLSSIEPIIVDNKWKNYFLSNHVLLIQSSDENDMTFKILHLNNDGISEEVCVNPATTVIDFYSYNDDKKEKMFYASFDSYTDSWDVRIKMGYADLPVSLEKALIYSNQKNSQGIVNIIDNCKNIFEKSKSNKYQKSP